ncbi:MAG: ATP-dependent DNA helicase RecG [Bacteroidota bacterium]
MTEQNSILNKPIEYTRGVGAARADLLKKELQIFTVRDLLQTYPFRYVDKTKFHRITDLQEDSDNVQLRGILRRLEVRGEGRKKRLVARLRDESGALDLVWFKGISYIEKQLAIGEEYVVYGKVNAYGDWVNLVHPEMELVTAENTRLSSCFEPVYPSTEKLNSRGLDSKGRRKIILPILDLLAANDLPENLPSYLIEHFRFPTRIQAIKGIHFPQNEHELKIAQSRLKFEELFFMQLRLLQLKSKRKSVVRGYVFANIGQVFNTFFKTKLPFELTNAQKRVLKEIRRDLKGGVQMNRLLQGDVGSGKTIVALMTMLMALDNGFQACLMAPTEILAQQHFQSIGEQLTDLGVKVDFLSGSVKGKKRRLLLEQLAEGEIDILIGTHALIEDPVVFKNLGLAIIDEQHRFGVKQRAKLWKKNTPFPPHILVMTATPIPRTLAMTLYGDLDVSIIDELPPGRKQVRTVHKTENHRIQVFEFMRSEIKKGRQVYVVYPLIEESATLDLKNLEEGFEAISREFPIRNYQISVVHGRMKPADKEFEMQRFVRHETQIMIATTVIEVGVNVPNASVMVIENTERFGLSQLHQLRGRVGRGAEQSFCILMSSFKLSADGKERIQTMCRTNDGFEIAEADLRLRGPGNIEGTQQSGILSLRIADLAKDNDILVAAREIATRILEKDPNLEQTAHQNLKTYLEKYMKGIKGWSRIS